MKGNRKVILGAAATVLLVSLACNFSITREGEDYNKALQACNGNQYIQVTEELLEPDSGFDYENCQYRYTFTNTHPTDTISLVVWISRENTLESSPDMEWETLDTLRPGASTIYTCSVYHFSEQTGAEADDQVPAHTTRDILKGFSAVLGNSSCTLEIDDVILEDMAKVLVQNYCK